MAAERCDPYQVLRLIYDEEPLIKVLCKVDRERGDLLRSIVDVWSEKLDQGLGVPKSPSDLSPGNLVLVRQNKEYHRAKILHTDHKTFARQASVYLIDVGETTVVSTNDIRMLNCVEHLSSFPLTPLVEEYILNSVVMSRQWNVDERILAETALRSSPDIRVVGILSGRKIVDVNVVLDNHRINFSLYLKNARLAELVAVEHLQALVNERVLRNDTSFQYSVPPNFNSVPTQPPFSFPVQTPILPSVPYPNMSMGPPPGMLSYQRFRGPKPPSPVLATQQPPSSVGIDTLPVGATYEVYVSHVQDGMNSFTVQLKDNVDEKLPRLMASINDARPQPFTDPLGPGVHCLGKFNSDQSLCRAVVTTVLNDGAILYFQDFGNTEVISFNDIYQIPPKFLQEKAMALRFTLANLDSNYSLTTSEANSIFADLVLKEDMLTIKVTKPEVSTKQYCELFVGTPDGKRINIKNKVLDKVKLMKPAEYKKLTFKKNNTSNVVVSFAEMPSRFFVQVEVNQPLLDIIMQNVQDYCTSAENKDLLYAEDVNENMAVCAWYKEDGKWYRGLILDEADVDGNVSIFYVDFGNQEMVHYSKLRIMNNEMISQYPMQAIECRLDIESELALNETVQDTFVDLVDGNAFVMTVKNALPGNIFLVDLTDCEGVSIAEALKEELLKSQNNTSPHTNEYNTSPEYSSKTQSKGNWRDKNSSGNNTGDFSAFRRGENQQRYSRSDSRNESDERNSHSRNQDRRQMDGEDVTDDSAAAFNKKSGDNWVRDKPSGGSGRSSDGGDNWRNDRFNKRNTEENGGRRPPFKGNRRDDEAEDCKRHENENWGSNRRDTNWKSRADEGNDWGKSKVWSNENDSRNANSFGKGNRDRPPRGDWKSGGSNNDEGGWGNTNQNDGGKRDGDRFNSDHRRGNMQDGWNNNQENASNGDSWGVSNTNNRYNGDARGGRREYRSNDDDWSNKRDGGGFNKRRENDNYSQNRQWGNRSEFSQKSTLLDGFEKGSRFVESSYQPGQQIEVAISWFVNPQRFFVMPAENADFRQLMEDIQTEYPKRKPLQSNELTPNDHVVARYKDDVIYRANLLRTRPGGAIVTFLDYGNTESVGNNQVWAVNADHCIIPLQSVCCSLHNILPVGESGATWNSNTDFDKYFGNDKYHLTFIEYVEEENNKFWTVELKSVDNQDIAEQLVADNIAVRKICIQSEDLYDISLLKNQVLAVFPGYLETSKKFFVHIEPQKAERLRQGIAAFTEHPESLTSLSEDEIQVGEFCLAYPEGSPEHYRALILSLDQESKTAHVLFIDYGDEDDVSYDKIKSLPDYLCTFNPQAVECVLHDSESFAEETEFVEALSDKDFIIKVMDVIDNKLHVILYDITGNRLPYPTAVEETISTLIPFPIAKRTDKVLISNITQDKLYLQRISDISYLEELNLKLNAKYDQEQELEKVNLEPGKMYAGKSAAYEAWYRCLIETPESETVFYPDYGNTEAISELLAVRPLDKQFFEDPVCCMAVSTSVKLNSEEDLVPLIDAVQSIIFDAVFTRINANEWFVELKNERNRSFADYVIEKNCGVIRTLPEVDPMYNAFENWQLNEEMNVVVSAVYSPSRFYLQKKEDAEKITQLQEGLQSALKNLLPAVGKFDDLVAGKRADAWYRCYQKEAIAIDFGFEVDTATVKRLPTVFGSDQSKYTVECQLNVSSLENDWSEEAVARFKELMTSEGDVVARLEFKKNKLVVDILVNGKSVSETLVNENLAKFTSHKIVISHVVSLGEFFIQEDDAQEVVYEILDILKEADSWETVVPEIGDTVAAKFADDEQWYRAVVKSKAEDGTTVKFIDYGNEAVCEDFKQLPEKLKTIPNLALQCVVHPLPEDTSELHVKFVEFVNNNSEGDFSVYFLSRIEPMLVMLYFDEEIIENMLKEPEIPPIVYTTVTVSHLNAPSSFYVIPAENRLLKVVETNLAGVENSEAITEPLIDAVYAAKYSEDELWYRAKVLKTDGSVNVIFIDYGNISDVTEIRNLPEKLRHVPPLAKHCAISSTSEIKEWSEKAAVRFYEWINDGLTVFNIHFKEEGDPSIVNLDENGVSVANELETLSAVPTDVTEIPTEEIGYETVTISHINSPDDFYVLATNNNSLEMVEAELVGIENMEPVTEPLVDSIYVAKYPGDQMWYRARVISSGEMITVIFVDYGNASPVSEVRNLPDSLKSIPFSAKHCTIGPAVGSGEWPESAVLRLMELSCDGTTTFSLNVKQDGDPAFVDLYSGDLSVSNELKRLCDVGVVSPVDIVESNVTSESIQYDSVTISHINSPASFYVIPVENAQLGTVETNLANVELTEPVAQPKIGSTYAAQFTEDGLWYRAKILTVGEPITVLFVDYGNSSPVTEIRELPESLRNVPFLAKHCAIPFPTGLAAWPTSANARFAELSCDGITVFQVNLKEDGDPAFVDLEDNGVSIADELETLCKADLTAPLVPKSKPKVNLSFISSLDRIWIQYQTPQVDEMANEMANAETFDALENAQEGTMVAALFEDDYWYRAKVLGSGEGVFRVLFVDYGNEAEVRSIKHLPEDLVNLSPLAKCCKLQGVDERTIKWPEAVAKLEELNASFGTFLVSNMEEGTDGYGLVSLECEDGADLVKILNKACIVPIVGDVVDAENSEDGEWYRCKVLNIEEDDIYHVCCVDSETKFTTKEVRLLSPINESLENDEKNVSISVKSDILEVVNTVNATSNVPFQENKQFINKRKSSSVEAPNEELLISNRDEVRDISTLTKSHPPEVAIVCALKESLPIETSDTQISEQWELPCSGGRSTGTPSVQLKPDEETEEKLNSEERDLANVPKSEEICVPADQVELSVADKVNSNKQEVPVESLVIKEEVDDLEWGVENTQECEIRITPVVWEINEEDLSIGKPNEKTDTEECEHQIAPESKKKVILGELKAINADSGETREKGCDLGVEVTEMADAPCTVDTFEGDYEDDVFRTSLISAKSSANNSFVTVSDVTTCVADEDVQFASATSKSEFEDSNIEVNLIRVKTEPEDVSDEMRKEEESDTNAASSAEHKESDFGSPPEEEFGDVFEHPPENGTMCQITESSIGFNTGSDRTKDPSSVSEENSMCNTPHDDPYLEYDSLNNSDAWDSDEINTKTKAMAANWKNEVPSVFKFPEVSMQSKWSNEENIRADGKTVSDTNSSGSASPDFGTDVVDCGYQSLSRVVEDRNENKVEDNSVEIKKATVEAQVTVDNTQQDLSKDEFKDTTD